MAQPVVDCGISIILSGESENNENGVSNNGLTSDVADVKTNGIQSAHVETDKSVVSEPLEPRDPMDDDEEVDDEGKLNTDVSNEFENSIGDNPEDIGSPASDDAASHELNSAHVDDDAKGIASNADSYIEYEAAESVDGVEKAEFLIKTATTLVEVPGDTNVQNEEPINKEEEKPKLEATENKIDQHFEDHTISEVVIDDDKIESNISASAIENISQDSRDQTESEDEPMTIDDGTNGAESSGVEDDANEHEVHAISDSEDDGERSPSIDEEQHMEVDEGVSADNGIEDDKPVSIGSDSEDATAHTNNIDQNAAKSNDVAEEEEEEDCVVIEDDTAEDHSPRRSGRSRKSEVKVRDLSSFDEDIEEITDEPVVKRHKSTPPAAMSITIRDARSLALDSRFQHIGDHGKKEQSKLVVIDTDSIMGRANAASVQALQNQNISVRPVSGVHHHSPTAYPTNIRASITPVTPRTNIISTSPKTNMKTTPIVTSPAVASLLPALTDDMFVLEAPSFIVPYIYEKPPADNLREIVDTIRKDLADQKKQEDVDVAEKEAKELEAMSEEQRKLAELARAADANKVKHSSSSKKRPKSGDDSWGESDTSTDDDTSDTEQRTKVLIKEADTDMDAIKSPIQADGSIIAGSTAKRDNYFESPLGKFFMDIAVNLVQEHVQTDLLRQQKKRLRREGESAAPSVQMAIKSLTKNLEHSKLKNKMFKFETKRCEYCNFKSESALSMANHYEAPHLVGQLYKCNFCPFEARPPYDILFHMEAIHNVKARLDKAQTYHQCPNCPFEDNGKSKLARHALVCAKKFRPEVNLNPPLDWEPPAKIPRIKPKHGLVGTATAYQAMAAQAQRSATNAALLQQRQNAALANAAAVAAQLRGRGRPQTTTKSSPAGSTVIRNNIQPQQHLNLNRSLAAGLSMQNTSFQMNATGQFVQAPGPKSSKSQQPSISITPLPRQSSINLNPAISIAQMQAAAAMITKPANAANMKPGQTHSSGSKTTFVICEICDGYIKDLDQLRNHMQWMHKVKIHPKMIYNRPPLNCQKCQFRFFTDQGLERHLLGSHGLVTSSMQEAANKGKDSGRCPVCGRMYQWKLLNHVSRDHNMTLKPAHLSYKCTVCTATFGMYKQFENHVYSAHSNVAKKAMDVKSKGATPTGSGKSTTSNHNTTSGGDSLLKPLKINDEITIIPQPAHSRYSRGGGGSSGAAGTSANMESHVIEIL